MSFTPFHSNSKLILFFVAIAGGGSMTSTQSSQAAVSQTLDIDKKWDEASQQLSVVLESGGEFLTDIVPFDAASDIPIDDQK